VEKSVSTDTEQKYSMPMRLLHWSIALVIFGLLCLGWYMVPYQEGKSELWDRFYYFHKSFGVLVFLLIVLRLIVRWRTRVPELPATLPARDRKLAKIGHVLLYVLMVVTPLLGYSMSSSFKDSDGVYLFSLFHVPELLPKNDAAFEFFDRAHAIAAYTLLGLVVIHIAGVIKHRYFDKNKSNDVLPRML